MWHHSRLTKLSVWYYQRMVETFEEILSVGGRSNSLGRTSEVIELVLDDKTRLDELYLCVFNDDAWIRMRAMDAIEKICRQHSEWLMCYVDGFQSELTSSSQPSIQWHLAQMYSQLDLSVEQKRIAISWLIDLLSNTEVDWIVSVNAMKTLVDFTTEGAVSIEAVMYLLKLQQAHKSKSVVRKADKFLLELSELSK